jgi:sec-independent protein translocase protein TatB
MFDVGWSEFLLVAVVALVVIGPKDLPKAMRVAGYWVGRMRGVARQFRSGFDSMVREAELEDMEKRWAAENERIMKEHATSAPSAEDAATAPVADSLPDDHSSDSVSVEKPEIRVAAEGTPPQRGDGVTS